MSNKEIKDIGKAAFKAGIWYTVSSIVVKGIAVLTTPIFTRVMTIEEYGNVMTFVSWYGILMVICNLNLNYSIGRAKLDFPGKLDDYIGSMTMLSSTFSLVIIAVILLFLKPIAALMELTVPMLALLMIYLFFAPAIQFVQNGCRYRYRYKENIAIAWYVAIVTVFVSLVLIFFVDGKNDVMRIVGIVVPNAVLSIIFWIKQIKNKNLNFNRTYWKYGIAISAPLILHTISLNILAQSDRIFITKLCGTSFTAVYSLAYTYGTLITLITNAVAEGWLPWFHDAYYAEKYDDIRKNVKKIIVLGCYVGLACVALAPEAIAILGGQKYMEGIYCVPPIVLGILFQYIYTHYVNIELHLKKTGYVSLGTVLAAALNVVLNAVFIPRFGYMAAAYTTLVGYIALFGLHVFITRRILHVKLYDDLYMAGAAVCAAVVTAIIVCTYEYDMIRYGLTVIGFVSFLIVYKDYAIRIVRNKLKKDK